MEPPAAVAEHPKDYFRRSCRPARSSPLEPLRWYSHSRCCHNTRCRRRSCGNIYERIRQTVGGGNNPPARRAREHSPCSTIRNQVANIPLELNCPDHNRDAPNRNNVAAGNSRPKHYHSNRPDIRNTRERVRRRRRIRTHDCRDIRRNWQSWYLLQRNRDRTPLPFAETHPQLGRRPNLLRPAAWRLKNSAMSFSESA